MVAPVVCRSSSALRASATSVKATAYFGANHSALQHGEEVARPRVDIVPPGDVVDRAGRQANSDKPAARSERLNLSTRATVA